MITIDSLPKNKQNNKNRTQNYSKDENNNICTNF